MSHILSTRCIFSGDSRYRSWDGSGNASHALLLWIPSDRMVVVRRPDCAARLGESQVRDGVVWRAWGPTG